MLGWIPLLLGVMSLLGCPGIARSEHLCPWNEEDLELWNVSSTWNSGTVPTELQEVTIPSGKRVLLNTSPPLLGSLTIDKGAALIWGDIEGLVLNTHYILVRGEFQIGSQSCRFTKKAHIRLHGKTDSPFYVEERGFGRKFIGVCPGGTLELHGQEKTSWTKLAQTVKPTKNVDCAVIYDHSDGEENLIALEKQNGLHVIVWNEDGSVMDFKVFKIEHQYQDFEAFFTTIPTDKVIAMIAFGAKGLGRKTENLEATIRDLGGNINGQVRKKDSYSFIGRKGDVDSVKESTKADGQKYPSDGFLELHDPDRGIVFQVLMKATYTNDYFRVLNDDVVYPVLTLTDEVVNWAPGDEVLVTSTDYDWKQAEVRRIIECNECTSRRQIKVDKSFDYLHFGNFTYNVDERAEVAMLTRNIVIEGVMEDECYKTDKEEKKLCKKFYKDTFGGHLKIVKNHHSVHIRGVEVRHMGQQKIKGAYPLHFHMCDDAPGMYLKENSIHSCFSRCITIHGTDKLNVSENVCYDHLGHGLFIEDGVEQENVFIGNLVAGTQHGTLLLSDMDREWCRVEKKRWLENCGDLASYWITHPNNIFINNVAAGSDGHGFMVVFADLPLGPSYQRQLELNRTHHPKDIPIRTFTMNVAHSNQGTGVFMDSKISTGTGIEDKGRIPENGIIQTENEYDPHENGQPVWVNMSYGTYYKNGRENMWIKGGNIRVSYSTLADSSNGFGGGTTLFDTGTEVYKSIFIGETENKGRGRIRRFFSTKTDMDVNIYFDRSFFGSPTATLTAVALYQGPVFVKQSFFDKYKTKTWCLSTDEQECNAEELITRHAGAISFKRSNNYPTMTSVYIENNTFGFCDNRKKEHWVFMGDPSIADWQYKDGDYAVFFQDKDGQVAGRINGSVVRNIPLYGGPKCRERTDWGPLMVCPYRYVKLEVEGSTGNLAGGFRKDYPLIIQRDDNKIPFSIQGEIRNEFLLRTHRSYIIDFNFTKPGSAFPSDYKIFGYGVERQDKVRVGICQPRGVQRFEISSNYPAVIKNNATWVTSLAELDADTTGTAFFNDTEKGILFFKMMSFHSDTNETQQCPGGKCFLVKINVIGGDFTQQRSCAGYDIPSFEDSEKAGRPRIPGCGSTTMPEDVGSVNWNDVDFVVHEDFSVPCLDFEQPADRGSSNYKGCYLERVNRDTYQTDLISLELIELGNSMTVDFCVNRCYGRGYLFAGLSRGRRCTCGDILFQSSEFEGQDSDCSIECVGGDTGKAKKATCGGQGFLDVWTTGKPTT